VGLCALVAALALALPAAEPDEPELLVLPLEVEGVKPQIGLDAWKIVVDEITRSKSRLKVSLKLQHREHDMLLGPAREQAKDCGTNSECLREIGSALEAGVVVAGKVTKDAVTLIAIDVASGQRLAFGKSPSTMASGPLDKKARLAVNILVATYSTAHSGGKRKGEGAVAEKADRKINSDRSAKDSKPELRGDAKPDAKLDADNAPEDKGTESGDTPRIGSPVFGDAPYAMRTSTEAKGTEASAATPGAATSTSAAVLAAETRSDLVPPPPVSEESVSDKWWFWTGLGAAVLAGSAIAIVLAGGTKGGPTVPSDSGTIQGTY
jgi:hypothetical protein